MDKKKRSMEAKGLTIAKKLGLNFSVLTLLIVLGGLAGLNGVNALSKALTFVTTQAWDAADGAMEGVISVEAQIIAVQGIVLHPDEAEKYKKVIKDSKSEASESFERMLASGLFNEKANQNLKEKYGGFNNAADQLTNYILSGGRDSEKTKQYLDQLDGATEVLLEFLDGLEERADGKVEGELGNIAATQNAAYTLVFVALAIGVVIAFFGYRLSISTIVNPLKHTVSVLNDLSKGEGDLTVRLPVKGKDEVAQVAEAFNEFVEKIRNTVESISGATAQLASASEEMNAIMAGTMDSVSQQRSETDQVATAMNQMSATTQEVARNAAEASGSADEADQNAREGQQVVGQTIDSIQRLANEVESASKAIQQLAIDSGNIGSVLDVIKDIAEQTNLLALNAAIEAARAGEQGRGFAVVADEVRTLASRTRESTEEIEQMIQKFQHASSNAVSAMEAGQEAAGSSVEQSSQARDALQRITDSVQRIVSINAQIATASEEQGAVAEEVNRSVTNINTIAIESEENARQTTASSEELAQLATRLGQIVSQFKV